HEMGGTAGTASPRGSVVGTGWRHQNRTWIHRLECVFRAMPRRQPLLLLAMPLRLSEHPEYDRPRERFWAIGPGALTGQELLAILLGTGTRGRDALAVAAEILARGEGSLRRLATRPWAELAQLPGVGRSKAARLAAAIERGRRVGTETEPPPERIRGPGPVQRHYRARMRDRAVEGFHVVALGRQSQMLADLRT